MRAKLNAQPNQSLIDGIATLQALATSPEPVGCRELARRLDADPTKINRLLKTLAYLGIARQTANRKYTAGAGMHVLAAQSLFASGLIRRALPVLENLRRFGHTVALGVLWGDSVSYLFHAPPGIEASRGLGRIGLLPATTSGIGIVLLSELDDDEVRDIYRDKDIPMFPEGIEQLLAKLAEVRRLGYARVHVADERDHHVVAVSTGDPAHAGIALSGWIPEAATEPLVAALREAAPEIGG
ncbi:MULTISPECIES: IclR family transcriptional regulator [Sphingomonas]|uniref:DNA-binding IclR family transcriptional regulator n=1 Tax=Sphingomonas kyeonggiensis TaxID=1268553 RepID=A0A7W7NR31_9SPHN|nr:MULTISPECIES: helix-turn-helix domain-containing protein [Sphingomonas]MBB4837331.1 DNA-binding IclR family transcriptional regulator [Sphingomonas kyeonggiensis]WHU02122.1 helix-turn-helix domain-containing protein [Sphingomonas sp. NIBR02145]